MKYIVLCIAIFASCCVESSVLPVEKCNLEDSECLKTQFQKAVPVFMGGIPELGIPVMDVMDLENFQFDISGLKFSMADGKLQGLKSAVVDNVKWNLKKNTFQVEFHLDSDIKGHYTADGRILILPITGDGDIVMKLKNAHLKFEIEYEMKKSDDGKEYLVPKKLHFDFEVKDNTNFHLTNLFNGNKELSDAMLKFLNENWQQITSEFGRPMIEAAAKVIFKAMKVYFKKNAIREIADF